MKIFSILSNPGSQLSRISRAVSANRQALYYSGATACAVGAGALFGKTTLSWVSRCAPDSVQPACAVNWRNRYDLDHLYDEGQLGLGYNIMSYARRNKHNPEAMQALFDRYPEEVTFHLLMILRDAESAEVEALVVDQLAERDELPAVLEIYQEPAGWGDWQQEELEGWGSPYWDRPHQRAGVLLNQMSPDRRYELGAAVAQSVLDPRAEESETRTRVHRPYGGNKSRCFTFVDDDAALDCMRGYLSEMQIDMTNLHYINPPYWFVVPNSNLADRVIPQALAMTVPASVIRRFFALDEEVALSEDQQVQLWRFIRSVRAHTSIQSLEELRRAEASLQAIHSDLDGASLIHCLLLHWAMIDGQIDLFMDHLGGEGRQRLLNSLDCNASRNMGMILGEAERYDLALEIYHLLPTNQTDFLDGVLWISRDAEGVIIDWERKSHESDVDHITDIVRLLLLLPNTIIGVDDPEQLDDEAKQHLLELRVLLAGLAQLEEVDEVQIARLDQLITLSGPHAIATIRRSIGQVCRPSRDNHAVTWLPTLRALTLALPRLPSDEHHLVFDDERQSLFYRNLLRRRPHFDVVNLLESFETVFSLCPPRPSDLYPAVWVYGGGDDEGIEAVVASMLYHCHRRMTARYATREPLLVEQESAELDPDSIGTLAVLPPETLFSIASYLDRSELAVFGGTNRYLHHFTHDSQLWASFAPMIGFHDIEAEDWRSHMIGAAQMFDRELTEMVQGDVFETLRSILDRGHIPTVGDWAWIMTFGLSPGQCDRVRAEIRSQMTADEMQQLVWVFSSQPVREVVFTSPTSWMRIPEVRALRLLRLRHEPDVMASVFNDFFPANRALGWNDRKPKLAYLLGLYSVTNENRDLVEELLSQHEGQDDPHSANIAQKVRRGMEFNPILRRIDAAE